MGTAGEKMLFGAVKQCRRSGETTACALISRVAIGATSTFVVLQMLSVRQA